MGKVDCKNIIVGIFGKRGYIGGLKSVLIATHLVAATPGESATLTLNDDPSYIQDIIYDVGLRKPAHGSVVHIQSTCLYRPTGTGGVNGRVRPEPMELLSPLPSGWGWSTGYYANDAMGYLHNLSGDENVTLRVKVKCNVPGASAANWGIKANFLGGAGNITSEWTSTDGKLIRCAAENSYYCNAKEAAGRPIRLWSAVYATNRTIVSGAQTELLNAERSGNGLCAQWNTRYDASIENHVRVMNPTNQRGVICGGEKLMLETFGVPAGNTVSGAINIDLAVQ